MPASQPSSTLLNKHAALKSAVLATLGALLFGFIALLANLGHSWNQIMIAVSGQMAMCFLMTFTSASMMQIAFGWPSKPLIKFLAASAGVGLFSLTLMSAVHIAIGTPEVVKTVAAATAISFFYYVAFPLHLLTEYYAEQDQDYRNQEPSNQNWGLRWFANPYDSKEYLATVWRNIVGPHDTHRLLTSYISNTFELDHPKASAHSRSLRIGFLGDLMPMKNKQWELSPEISALFSDLDYLVANFEGNLGSGPYSLMCQPHCSKVLEGLKRILPAEKIILSVANNHAADFDYSQFVYTCEQLNAQGFQVIGSKHNAALELEEHLNLVACTQWTNQHHGYLSFLEHAQQSIQSDRFNILLPHWGYELELFPRPEWIQSAKHYLEDFDMIVGHHSHVPGPVHCYKDSQGREKLVAYSLGDSATGMSFRHYQHGLALVCDFQLDNGQTHLTQGQWQFTRLKQQRHIVTLQLAQRAP